MLERAKEGSWDSGWGSGWGWAKPLSAILNVKTLKCFILNILMSNI